MENLKRIITLEELKITSIDIIKMDKTETIIISPTAKGTGVDIDQDSLVIHGIDKTVKLPLREVSSVHALYDAHSKEKYYIFNCD